MCVTTPTPLVFLTNARFVCDGEERSTCSGRRLHLPNLPVWADRQAHTWGEASGDEALRGPWASSTPWMPGARGNLGTVLRPSILWRLSAQVLPRAEEGIKRGEGRQCTLQLPETSNPECAQ